MSSTKTIFRIDLNMTETMFKKLEIFEFTDEKSEKVFGIRMIRGNIGDIEEKFRGFTLLKSQFLEIFPYLERFENFKKDFGSVRIVFNDTPIKDNFDFFIVRNSILKCITITSDEINIICSKKEIIFNLLK